MDEVTQQNAALVEEAAAAAESLQEQAQGLTEAVAVFKLSGGEQSKPASPKKAEAAEPAGERRGPDRTRNVARLPAKTQSKSQAEKAEPKARAKIGHR